MVSFQVSPKDAKHQLPAYKHHWEVCNKRLLRRSFASVMNCIARPDHPESLQQAPVMSMVVVKVVVILLITLVLVEGATHPHRPIFYRL